MASSLWKICVDSYFLVKLRIRADRTQLQYHFAITNLGDFVGHDPTTDDLSDDNVAGMMGLLLRHGLSATTVNERRGRINALWTWCAKRGIVKTFPTVQPIPEPERTPIAWNRDELAVILRECDVEGGRIAGIPARLWWSSLHLAMWDSSERIGALLAVKWSMLHDDFLIIPAEVRKGGRRDRAYQLHANTLAMLSLITVPHRELVWPWDRSYQRLWGRYKLILKRAGLPADRNSMFHRMRRSVASHYEAAGGNATELLGHSDRRTTIAGYLDPTIVPQAQAIDRLFRPNSG